MRKLYVACLVVALGWLAVSLNGAEDEKPKYTIKQVMKAAHKGGLLNKVKSGKASDDEKKELIAMYEALGANTPPKGDAESWKEKTAALLEAAESGDAEKLAAASKSCAACHKAHKGK